MHVGIVAQRENPRAVELAAEIRDALRQMNIEVTIDTETADALDTDGAAVNDLADCALVVSIGGDGTFLFTARGVTPTPVMGVNLGEVGFLNVTSPDDAVESVRTEVTRLRENDDPDFQRMPQVNASADGQAVTALNEVAIVGESRGHGQGISHEVRVDGNLYGSGRADGVLVATPTGSTAYNLSEGGPLVHPGIPGFVLTEMVGEEAMPSLVIDTDATVTIQVDATERAHVVGDGRTSFPVDPPTQVTIERATTPVRVAGPTLDFFAALSKLD